MNNSDMTKCALTADIIIEHSGWGNVTPLVERCFEIVANAGIIGVKPGSVAILLTDDSRLAQLNLTYRNRPGSTNILSFPADPAFACFSADSVTESGVDPIPVPFWGDLAVSYETCYREAARSGISLHDHLAHLVVHGLLHLFGYDHQNATSATRMEAIETRVLAAMAISDPYGRHEETAITPPGP